MRDWNQFALTRHGSQINRFFHKLNTEIAEVTENPDKPDGMLLLNTKKGYWLYKVFDREETVHSLDMYSDCYAQKLIDYTLLKDKLIYLVDDTLIHGNGLLDTYRLLAANITDIQNICPVVFALHEDIDPKEKAGSAKGIEQTFWNALQYYIRMTDQEIGDFCISVTNLLHSAGIPYTIELPYLKDEKHLNKKTNFDVVLTGEQFGALQKNTLLWKFQWNSYQVREVNFLQGFIIHMEDEPLLSAVRDCFIDFAVTGTYTNDHDGKYHIVFVPFAMAKSVTKERVKQLWNLFAEHIDIPPDDSLPDEGTAEENRLWVNRYRECIYMLSMVIAERFKKHLKSLTDISLVYDDLIIKEHFPGNFASRAQALEKALNDEPDLIYQKLLRLADSVPEGSKAEHFSKVNDFTENKQEKEEYNESNAYNIILDEIHKRKENVLQGQKLALLEADDIHRLLRQSFYFKNEKEERYAQSNIIAVFLLSSIFGSRLQISEDGTMIIKGYRYGENSDLALKFFNLFFYWGIVLLSEKYEKNSMKQRYDRFISKLWEQFHEMGLLADSTMQKNFEQNQKYYKNVIDKNLHLYNKSFYLKPFYRDELPESEVKIMYQIEDFVANKV